MLCSLPHHTLQKLARQHGPLMYLQLGELSTIVVSSPKVAKEVLQTNGLAFANRPNLTLRKIFSHNCLGFVAFSPYGESWRQMRQIYVEELLRNKSIRSSLSIFGDGLSEMVTFIKSQKGRPIILGEVIMSYLYSTICKTTVGRAIRRQDQDALIIAAKETGSLGGVFNLADNFPSSKIVQFIVAVKPYPLEKLRCKIDCILEKIISNREKNKINDLEEEDILDVLLRLEKKNDSQFPITRNQIKAMIFELSVAGTLTSLVVAEWTMAELMKTPRVMEKAQWEVRQAIIGKEKISADGTDVLTYLNRVIKESLRLHPPGPLLAPRESRERCEIGGYTIPSETITIINAWAIGRDPDYWNDPDVFKPERFSDTSIDFMGTNFELIPFGAGRRICPGINYGVSNIRLLLAHLHYHFNWRLPDGIKTEELDMTEKFGAAAERKYDLCLHAEMYNP